MSKIDEEAARHLTAYHLQQALSYSLRSSVFWDALTFAQQGEADRRARELAKFCVDPPITNEERADRVMRACYAE